MNSIMKKLLVIASLFAIASLSPAAEHMLSIGAGSSGGGSYQIGAAYSEIINKLPNISLNVEETAGGIENIQLIEDRQIDFGTGNTGAAYDAIRGRGVFKDAPATKLRGWIPMYAFPFQIVTLKDRPINSVKDLIGKRVSVNARGNAAENTARQIFTSLGMMKPDGDYNFEAFYLSYSEALDNIKIGRLDAIIVSTGAPTPTVLELEATQPIKIVAFTDEEMATVAKDHPYYSAGVIKGGTYGTIKEDVKTMMAATVVYTHADLPEQVIYDITKAVWENRKALEAAHPTQKDFNAALVNNAMLPVLEVHPGSLRYFKEIGVIK